MRCHEARKKLIKLAGGSAADEEKEALLEHLNRCPHCARLALAERVLIGDLQQLRRLPALRPISVEQVRKAIAIREESEKKTNLGVRIMRQVSESIYRRPRLSIATATVSVLLLLSILVPVRTEHPVGYEVAFAAPVTGMVLHQENTEKMLAALNMHDARVRVQQSREGVEYRIAPLTDSVQVRRLIEALDSLGGRQVRGRVAAARSENRTIWQLLFDDIRLTTGSSPAGARTEKHTRITIDSLDGRFQDDFTLWMPIGDQTGESLRGLLLDREGEKTTGSILGLESGDMINDCGMNQFLNGNTVMNIRMPDGEQVSLDLTNIKDVRRLERAGYNFVLMEFDTPGQLPIPGMGPKFIRIKPNPFAEATTIKYMVPQAYEVKLQIVDERGREVRTLLDCIAVAGIYGASWDGRDADGNRVMPGTYLCRFMAGDYVETKEIVLEHY